jgi:hypothetical protein
MRFGVGVGGEEGGTIVPVGEIAAKGEDGTGGEGCGCAASISSSVLSVKSMQPPSM